MNNISNTGMASSKFNQMSIINKGARFQFDVAIVLLSVLPTMTAAYLFQDRRIDQMDQTAVWLIAGMVAALAFCGYWLLLKYPRTIIRLRSYMTRVASGELSETISLDEESDISTVEKYLNLVVIQMKERVATIEGQKSEIIELERKRVMLETVCAACHHLGQPATIIATCLEMMRSNKDLPSAVREHLNLCAEAVDQMHQTFHQLQCINRYETTPYCPVSQRLTDSTERMLVIDADPQDKPAPRHQALKPTLAVAAPVCATAA